MFKRPLPLAICITIALMSNMAHAEDWMDQARQRIAQYRMADLQIQVRDALGQPLPNATVQVQMRRHAFGFGTAVSEDTFIQLADPHHPRYSPHDSEKYRHAISKYFNMAVIENGLKWGYWEDDSPRRERTIDTIEWLLQHGHDVRGHVMIWQRWERTPTDLRNNPANQQNPDYLRQRIAQRIQSIGSHPFENGVLKEWDVLNEHRAHHLFTDILNPQAHYTQAPELVEWFKQAREAAPNAKLYFNDYNVLEGHDAAHFNSFKNTAQYMVDNGAPVDGLGLQAHFNGSGSRVAGPQLLTHLDSLAELGTTLKITEFDMTGDGWTEPMKADYIREFLIAIFSHPAVDGFLMWVFWDGRHWRGSAPLFDVNWNLKQSGQAYLDLVFDQWWTREQGTTNGMGNFATRGFLGDYEVKVIWNGHEQTRIMTLGSEGWIRPEPFVIPEPASLTILAFGATLRRTRASRPLE